MSPTSPDRRTVLLGCLGVVGVGAVVALLRGDLPATLLGVTAPPVAVTVATALARLVVLLAAGATVGGLVGALVARPSRDTALGAPAYATVCRAGAAAAVWAVGALAAAVLTVLVGTGSDPRILTTPDAFLVSAGALEEPAGFLVAAVLAGVVATLCRVTLSWRTTAGDAARVDALPRADGRDATRRDRHADRDGDAELAAWNRMLADLARGR
ncbi:hypothetical protein PHK61_20660 [Actinomycetospora lutea]|uniref:hypothetical protein n=1 Tax=Actinomycetospora lutea TaxID=663604 RepID=UPI002365B0D4|nr:hypothetical protein [Actinomycetospora lutea]MDD7940838.1 hypothetical protein [Actinomycetospora lutea]